MLTRLAFAVLLVFGAGCGRAPDRASPPPDPAPSAPASTSAATSPPAASGSALEADASQQALVLAQLTQAVRRYGVEQRKAPKTFEELVAKGYLSSIPQAPAGKKFAISQNLEVYLAD